MWDQKLAPNGRPPTTLPEANRAEGNVGGALRRSSAEPQARGLPVTFFQVTCIKGAAWVGLLGAGQADLQIMVVLSISHFRSAPNG